MKIENYSCDELSVENIRHVMEFEVITMYTFPATSKSS
jgi:hypothetical protein